MSIAIAILGLAFLIFIHECGHFFASLAVGLRPRRFYVGFPPAIAKVKKNNIEYAVGAIPLGGFVTIPGMHRPVAHDAERRFERAVADAPVLTGPYERIKRALAAEDWPAASEALDDFEELMREQKLAAATVSTAEKGLTEIRDALGSDAYWKAPTWKRIVAIAAGPAANILLAIVLFSGLYMTSVGKATTTVDEISQGSPAQGMGLQPGDRILQINGSPVGAGDISRVISGSDGGTLTVVVARKGREVTLPPTAPQMSDGAYRLGFVLAGEGLPLPEAA